METKTMYILLKGKGDYTKRELKNNGEPENGSTIDGIDCDPVELGRYENERDAYNELCKYDCRRTQHSDIYSVVEYGVQECEINEDDEIVEWGDVDLACRKMEHGLFELKELAEMVNDNREALFYTEYPNAEKMKNIENIVCDILENAGLPDIRWSVDFEDIQNEDTCSIDGIEVGSDEWEEAKNETYERAVDIEENLRNYIERFTAANFKISKLSC